MAPSAGLLRSAPDEEGALTHATWLFLALCAFWAALSGQFEERFLVVSGLVTTTVVTIAMVRLRLVAFDEWPLRRTVRAAVLYLPWIIWQAVLANARIIRLVWSPRLQVSPRLVRVPTSLRTDLGRATLANSITFTPGTTSILVEGDSILVHALTEADAAGVLDGSIEQRVARLESPS